MQVREVRHRDAAAACDPYPCTSTGAKKLLKMFSSRKTKDHNDVTPEGSPATAEKDKSGHRGSLSLADTREQR